MILRENSVSDHFTPPLDPPWEGYFILTPPHNTQVFLGGLSITRHRWHPRAYAVPKNQLFHLKKKAPERAQVRNQTDVGKSTHCTHSAPDP